MDLRRELARRLGLSDDASDEEILKALSARLGRVDDKLKLKGELEIRVYDRYGRLKEYRKVENLIVNVGKAQVAGLINGVVTTPFKYIAIGTGTTSPSAGDTALESEVDRAEATVGRTTTSVTNDTATFDATFNFTASYSITEAGIFDASSGGNMLARHTFSAINVQSGDSLTISWKVQVS
ncbi:MAG: hypothetical protein DRO12_02450 [Thermoprotei archaeon]|nr:MAG: hypothetical protein DRO12_02450 [Thermoprotei archaeon]